MTKPDKQKPPTPPLGKLGEHYIRLNNATFNAWANDLHIEVHRRPPAHHRLCGLCIAGCSPYLPSCTQSAIGAS